MLGFSSGIKTVDLSSETFYFLLKLHILLNPLILSSLPISCLSNNQEPLGECLPKLLHGVMKKVIFVMGLEHSLILAGQKEGLAMGWDVEIGVPQTFTP